MGRRRSTRPARWARRCCGLAGGGLLITSFESLAATLRQVRNIERVKVILSPFRLLAIIISMEAAGLADDDAMLDAGTRVLRAQYLRALI